MHHHMTVYVCDRCGDEQAQTACGPKEYIVGDGRLPMSTAIAWCYRCVGLRPVEVINPDSWRAAIESVIREISSAKVESKLFTKYISHLRDWGFDTWRTRLTMESLADWQSRLNIALIRQTMLTKRESMPRCLDCRSTGLSSHQLEHPGCGGTYTAESVGTLNIRRGAPQWIEVYSVDGEYQWKELRETTGRVLEREMQNGIRDVVATN